jgi:hypothetical protein
MLGNTDEHKASWLLEPLLPNPPRLKESPVISFGELCTTMRFIHQLLAEIHRLVTLHIAIPIQAKDSLLDCVYLFL